MLWDDEVREADFDVLDEVPRISQKERDMASQLVDSLAGNFDASQFTDDYQEQLRTLVEAKLEQGDALDTAATFGEQEEEGDKAEVIDLMDALQRSVEKSKKKKTSSSSKSSSKSTAKKKARKGA
jgi:DNA end-binding protein Ku